MCTSVLHCPQLVSLFSHSLSLSLFVDMSIFQDKEKRRRPKFCINDHVDVLIEIIKRLDGRSLCAAACVCRLWCTIARNDSLWEDLCLPPPTPHVSPPPATCSSVRPVVLALGGYRSLYMACVRPVLGRLYGGWRKDSDRVRRVWTRDELQLSLSLFSVDYYERLGRIGGGSGDAPASASSLMFLCKPVNV